MVDAGSRSAEVARFEALAQTLGLDSIALGVSATLRPGTLMASQPPLGAGTAPATRSPQNVARTLPRLDASAPGAASATSAELELVRLLGEGGMGAVWLAHQRSLDREVAVKRLRETGPATVEGALSLLSEGRATGALEHPNVVPVHALGLDASGAPLLVMKRVEGATLETLRDDPAHPAWPALERRFGDRLGTYVEVLMRVADALELAHARGFVHRDVKPENVMVGAFGEVYLLDWGVALRRDALTAEERARISIVGTPTFMAPELVAGVADRIDARTDVFLLGATLHALLTGRPRHDGATLHAVLVAALLSEPPEIPHDVPEELAALVRRATAADPAARPKSAAEFRDALGDFLRHRGSLRMALDAEARLDALAAAGGDPPAAQLAAAETSRALLECRFALARALEDWSGNVPARTALARTLRLLALAEVERRSPEAAAAFAAELATPDPELEARITALRHELSEGRRLEAEARREAHERDPAVAAGHRLILGAGILSVGVTIGLVGSFFATPAEGSLDAAAVERVSLAVNYGLVTAIAAVVFLGRRRLLANRTARQSVTSLLLAGSAFLFAETVSTLRGTPELDRAVLRTLAVAVALAGASMAMGRAPMLASALLLAAIAGITAAPEHAYAIERAGQFAAIGIFVIDTALVAARARASRAGAA